MSDEFCDYLMLASFLAWVFATAMGWLA